MPTFTIKTRNHGEKTFFVPSTGGYVRIENGRNHGTLGKQICYGGDLSGNTITCAPADLPKVARLWWKQRLAADLELNSYE